MKKAFGLCSMLLVLMVMASCGGSGSSGSGNSASAARPAKVVMGLISFNVIPEDISPVTDAINGYIKTKYPDANIELELKIFGPAEYENKMNLMMQSGDPLDVMIGVDFATAVASNKWMPITKYLDQYGKEMVAVIKEGCGDNIFDPYMHNGEIMAVPVNKDMVIVPTASGDLEMLLSTGFTTDSITDLQSLEKIYSEIIKKYPEVFPYVPTDVGNPSLLQLINGEERIDQLGNEFGVVIGNSSQVINFYDSDIFKKYSTLMRQWFNKGYMPKDMATSTMRGMDYFFANRAFSTFASYGNGGDIGPMFSMTLGRPIFAKPVAGYYFTTDSVNVCMAVPSTSKNPEAAVKFLNILYTDEFVVNTILWGREGVDYVKVDAHTVAFPEGKTAETVSYCQFLCSGVMGTEYIMWSLYTGGPLPTEQEYAASIAQRKASNSQARRSPYFGFRFDAGEVRNELTALSNAVSQYRPGLICGSVDVDSTLAAFNKALKDAGIEKVIAEKQRQLNTWIAANK